MKWRFIPAAVVIVVALFVPASAQDSDSQSPPSQTPDSTSEKAEQIRLGVPVHTVDPVLSKKLRKKRLLAVLNGTMGKDGNFHDLKILGGDRDFSIPALEAVSQWQYTPATVNGSPAPEPVFVTLWSEKGKLHSDLDLDTLPTEPDNEVRRQIMGSEIFDSISGGMKPPKALYCPDPEYSEKARKAKYQGTLVMGMVVGSDGQPKAVWPVRKLGLGLDEKAVDCLRHWTFKPATRDGKPVAAHINVEVMFRIY